ncbi:MAG: hypothetical protein HYZ42_00560 [Bacteroidetes bacterium]|nr:hypothetical protein [Bacteroidota bacterium]
MIRFFRQLYLSSTFFGVFTIFILLFGISFGWSWLFPLTQLLLLAAIVVFLFDLVLLYNKSIHITAERKTAFVLSLGSENDIQLSVTSHAPYKLSCHLIDEIPIQFQERKFGYDFDLITGENKLINYQLRPLSRGVYEFGKIHIYIKSQELASW